MSEAAPAPAPALLDVGIHYGIPADRYHADPSIQPSLSRSICWTLAQRAAIHGFLESPRLNPDHQPAESNAVMDFGSLGHALLLGEEDRIDIGDFKDYRTDAARLFRDTSRAAGRIPALKPVFERASLLRTCALAHLADTGFLADFEAAKSEVTVIGKLDDIYCRARFDKLLIDPAGAAHRKHSEIAIVFDVKITSDASPEAIQRLIGNLGLDVQETFYLQTLGEVENQFRGKTRFIFLFIENQFPFVVTPVELSPMFRAVGAQRFQRGFSKWARGIRKGEWPSFVEGEGAFVINPKKYLELAELEDEEPYEEIRLAENAQ